jgi:hypothetical protein
MGITVYGRWTIEVRNPDGKLASRREFENGLYPGSAYGATLLSALLGRAVTSGSWEVVLGDPTGADQISITEANSQASASCAINATGTSVCSAMPLTIASPPPTVVSGDLSGATLTLQGSAIVPNFFPATIGVVVSTNFACLPSSSPAACFNGTAFNNGTGVPFTLEVLNGTAGSATAPVPVTPGQTVSVNVVFSFASAS